MKLFDQILGMFGDVAQVEKTITRVRQLMMFTQDHIFSNGKFIDHAIAHAFFGDVGKHTVCDLARSKIGDLPAFEKNSSTGDFAQAGN